MINTQEFKALLLDCLGGEWPEPCPLVPHVEERLLRDGYTIEKVTYQVESDERVSAYVLIPDGVTPASPAPGIAVWHQHANNFALGKSEPAGLIGDPQHFTGVALAREGYLVFCPDALCFEERQDPVLRGQDFERFVFLRYVVEGKCLAWKYILDMQRGFDYMCSRPDVLADQLGCFGHSLGSIFTWLVGPWDERLRCLVGNCCLPTYAAVERTRLLHGFSLFIPGLKRFGDIPDIAALIAPRPLHLNFGAADRLSPLPEVRAAMCVIAQSYQVHGAEESFSYHIEEGVGHVFSETMWEATRTVFGRHLPINK